MATRRASTGMVAPISYEKSKFNFIHHRFKSAEARNMWWAKFSRKMGANPNAQVEEIDPMNHEYGCFNHTFLPTTNTDGLSLWCLWESKIGFTAADVFGFAESPGGPGRIIMGTEDCPFTNTVYMVDEQRNPDAMGKFARYFNEPIFLQRNKCRQGFTTPCQLHKAFRLHFKLSPVYLIKV